VVSFAKVMDPGFALGSVSKPCPQSGMVLDALYIPAPRPSRLLKRGNCEMTPWGLNMLDQHASGQG
jgi:hypothetical protein